MYTKYILTFQDDLSKFVIAVRIPQQNAETVAREIVLNIILKMGTPKQILTDQGADFLSDLFKNTCKLLKIKKLQTTPFRPESNGGLERIHRVLAEYLHHYVVKIKQIGMSGYPMQCTCITQQYTAPQDIHHLNLFMGISPNYLQYFTRHLAPSTTMMTT